MPQNPLEKVAHHIIKLGHMGICRKLLSGLQHLFILCGVWPLVEGIRLSILQR